MLLDHRTNLSKHQSQSTLNNFSLVQRVEPPPFSKKGKTGEILILSSSMDSSWRVEQENAIKKYCLSYGSKIMKEKLKNGHVSKIQGFSLIQISTYIFINYVANSVIIFPKSSCETLFRCQQSSNISSTHMYSSSSSSFALNLAVLIWFSFSTSSPFTL